MDISDFTKPNHELQFSSINRTNKNVAQKQKEKAAKELKLKCWKSKSISNGNLEVNSIPKMNLFKSAFDKNYIGIDWSTQPVITESNQSKNNSNVQAAYKYGEIQNQAMVKQDQGQLQMNKNIGKQLGVVPGLQTRIQNHNYFKQNQHQNANLFNIKSENQNYYCRITQNLTESVHHNYTIQNQHFMQQKMSSINVNQVHYNQIQQINHQLQQIELVRDTNLYNEQVQQYGVQRHNQPIYNQIIQQSIDYQKTIQIQQDDSHQPVQFQKPASIINRFISRMNRQFFKEKFRYPAQQYQNKSTSRKDNKKQNIKIYDYRQGLKQDYKDQLQIVQQIKIIYQQHKDKANSAHKNGQSILSVQFQQNIMQPYRQQSFEYVENANYHSVNSSWKPNYSRDEQQQRNYQIVAQKFSSIKYRESNIHRLHLPCFKLDSSIQTECYRSKMIFDEQIWDQIQDFDVQNRRNEVCDLIRQELDAQQFHKVKIATIINGNRTARLMLPADWSLQLAD